MKEYLLRCRIYFLYAGIFSLFVNLLMLTLPLYMLQVFDRVITSRSLETLMMLTIAAISALLIMMLLDMLRGRLLLGAGVALDELAGPAVITGLLQAGVKPGTNTFIAGLRDVATLRGFLTGNSVISLFDSPWAPIYIAIIFLFHPLLGWVALFGAVILFVLGYINEKITREPLDELSKASRKASSYIDAGLRNAEVLNALGMLQDLTRRWQQMNARVINPQVKASGRGAIINGCTKFLRLAIQILCLCIGAYLVIQQHVTTGVMMAATLLLARALAPVESAIVTWKGLVDARQSYHSLNELLADVKIQDATMKLPVPQGRLEVERALFSIPGSDRMVLRGVSFTLEPGESLGLIGPSAAGKSTLARLITGVWRPDSGSVRLDGADVSVWPREQLGPHIGYLPQDVELFAGTVADNIARLREPDNSAVLTAAEHAYVHDLILRLPKGYDTDIGPGGMALSGGQRQRVALARALYGKPRLVVLDEPNASLDSEGEDALVKTMQRLHDDGVTVIIISHRPSLLAAVDKLLVLREGQVEAYGPRNEIMQRVTQQRQPAATETPHLISRGR
jgi:PrtD family type I secretion system ABC transporter